MIQISKEDKELAKSEHHFVMNDIVYGNLVNTNIDFSKVTLYQSGALTFISGHLQEATAKAKEFAESNGGQVFSLDFVIDTLLEVPNLFSKTVDDFVFGSSSVEKGINGLIYVEHVPWDNLWYGAIGQDWNALEDCLKINNENKIKHFDLTEISSHANISKLPKYKVPPDVLDDISEYKTYYWPFESMKSRLVRARYGGTKRLQGVIATEFEKKIHVPKHGNEDYLEVLALDRKLQVTFSELHQNIVYIVGDLFAAYK